MSRRDIPQTEHCAIISAGFLRPVWFIKSKQKALSNILYHILTSFASKSKENEKEEIVSYTLLYIQH